MSREQGTTRRSVDLLDIATTIVLVAATTVVLVHAARRQIWLDDSAWTLVSLNDPPEGYDESVDAQEQLLTVLRNIRNVIMGLLAALATLLLTISGVRYLLGSGSPAETEKAKSGLKYAALGYGLAVLAPALTALLGYVVTFR